MAKLTSVQILILRTLDDFLARTQRISAAAYEIYNHIPNVLEKGENIPAAATVRNYLSKLQRLGYVKKNNNSSYLRTAKSYDGSNCNEIWFTELKNKLAKISDSYKIDTRQIKKELNERQTIIETKVQATITTVPLNPEDVQVLVDLLQENVPNMLMKSRLKRK